MTEGGFRTFPMKQMKETDPSGSLRWWNTLGIAGLLALPASAELPRIPLATGHLSERPREVLFLGRQVTVHHVPSAFHAMMRLPWAERDLRMKFTVNLDDLNPATLELHDALFIYGNAFYYITADQENAMEAYANGGGGVAAMHVACWSFPDSPKVTKIIGGAFLGHYAIQEFSQVILDVDHPILKGLGTYTAVDEPYQFKNLMPDRTILTVRTGPGPEEPMTWVRPQGQGRVFYHSGGHDVRTWEQPNFQELVTRGIEWVADTGDGPAVAAIDRARIANGGAIAVRAVLGGAGEVGRAAVFTLRGENWHRPLLDGETMYDLGSGIHRVSAADPLRVGGQSALPVLATVSKFDDGQIPGRWGLWSGRGGLARCVAREGSSLSWGSGFLTLASMPVGAAPELVMNASGSGVAQVFVTRAGFPELDTALVKTTAAGESAVLLVEGADPGLPGGPWTCGDLSSARLSLNNAGHLAAVLAGSGAKRLLLDQGSGWSPLLATHQSVPGLAVGTMLEELRDVRLNDAGSLVVDTRIDPGNGARNAILRRAGGETGWTIAMMDGPQRWLAEGESLVLAADGKSCLLDKGSRIWLRATVAREGVTSGCLVNMAPGGAAKIICREGALIELGGEMVTVSGLGGPGEWTCGPDGVACGRLTVTPASGPPREVLVRWNGRHALPVIESGRTFRGATGDFVVGSFRLDGGGTAEDGKGGFLTSQGEWVVTSTGTVGGDRLIHGADLADLDGDGRDDLLEAALGGNPLAADHAPLFGIEVVPGGAVLRYLQKTAGFFEYGVEASDDLATWHTIPADSYPATDQSGVPAGFKRMECAIEESPGFARIRVAAD